ncbi:hypothetical protein [Paraconexibacter sp. AEG42_29]
MPVLAIPSRFELSPQGLALIVTRAAALGIDCSRIYAALGIRPHAD